MTPRIVYMNGEYIPETEAKISIYDSALMFGDMVFEMTRSFNKKQFKLKEHVERLFAGAKILRIPLKQSVQDIMDICDEVVRRNDVNFEKNDEHRLLINVSRGPLSIYKDVFGGKMEPTVVVADFPLRWTVAAMAPLFDSGISAMIPSQRSIPAQYLDPKIKNRSRLFYLMANIEVGMMKGENNWALLIDPDGFITEGTGSNFFIVKNNVLITPEPRNILRGISRDYVIELAKQHGIQVVEKNIEPFDVYAADEAFMTATPFCILPVTKLGGETIGAGKSGEMTKMLLSAWGKSVGVNIEEQIKGWVQDEAAKLDVGTAPSPYHFSSKKS
jgi:branched-chain amino acid aminotransferase